MAIVRSRRQHRTRSPIVSSRLQAADVIAITSMKFAIVTIDLQNRIYSHPVEGTNWFRENSLCASLSALNGV